MAADEADGFLPPLRFVLEQRAAPGHRPLFVILSHSGRVLGRTRTLDESLAILGAHISSLDAPRSPDTFRVHLGALVSEKALVLFDSRLTARGNPLVERRLERHGLAVVDAPFIDFDSSFTSMALAAPTHPAESPLGHRYPSELGQALCGLIWSQPIEHDSVPIALLATELCAATSGPDEASTLSFAVDVVRMLPIQHVHGSALYEAANVLGSSTD